MPRSCFPHPARQLQQQNFRIWTCVPLSRLAPLPCRSVLAEAVFESLLRRSEERLHVEVESASVGPAYEGGHDPRVVQVPAQQR